MPIADTGLLRTAGSRAPEGTGKAGPRALSSLARRRGSSFTLTTVLALAVSLMLAGCADMMMLLNPQGYGIGSDQHRIGPVTVMIRSQQEVQSICELHIKVTRNQRILGCYISARGGDSATIVAIPDPYVILHEFKHYFEGHFHQ